MASGADPLGWHGKVVTVSEFGPRAYLYKNFLTPEECDYMIDKVSPPDLLCAALVAEFYHCELAGS